MSASASHSTLESQLRQCFAQLCVPGTTQALGEVASIESLSIDGDALQLDIALHFAAATVQPRLEEALTAALSTLPGVASVKLAVQQRISAHPVAEDTPPNVQKIGNIIAVASGKGGVGKSTSSVNLALALSAMGAKVGLLDADIYGPSQQLLLGVDSSVRPEQYGTQYLLPVMARGIKTMSMGYLVTDKTPMVWRGPMAAGALQQMLYQTWWEALDYLIIDMPPGTGDIQLTLSQKVPVAGSVIVTTPQDIALLDAKKGIEMFNKVNVPVLGVLENMAVHVCSQCGHHEHLFGEGGGAAMAADYGVPVLGSLPLSLNIRQATDRGEPLVLSEPESTEAQLYSQAALHTSLALAAKNSQAQAVPNIVISND